MELKKLVYECVKNAIYYDDKNFTYESFINGDYDSDRDYSMQINNVYAPLNEAIHRLSDRNKLQYKVSVLPPMDEKGIVDLSSLRVKNVSYVFYLGDESEYKVVPYRNFGINKLLISTMYANCDLFIEYKEDIKSFTSTDENVDLYEYGLDETMSSYIIEYVKGHLLETISPEIANMHITRAEQYMADLDLKQTSFSQDKIHLRYGVND